MKVISLKGRNLTVEMNEEERNIFFRTGLQCFINKDKNLKKKKLKVIPFNKNDGLSKYVKKKYEVEDELFDQLVKDGIVEAIKQGIK